MNSKLKAKLMLGTFLISGLFLQMSNNSLIYASPGKPPESLNSKSKAEDKSVRQEPPAAAAAADPSDGEQADQEPLAAAAADSSDDESSASKPPCKKARGGYVKLSKKEYEELEKAFNKILFSGHVTPEQRPVVERAIACGIHENAKYGKAYYNALGLSSKNEKNALHKAVERNNEDMVRILVSEGGMDVNKDCADKPSIIVVTPVTLAVHFNRDNILHFLMDNGGKLEDAAMQIACHETLLTPYRKTIIERFRSVPRDFKHGDDNSIICNAIFSGNFDLIYNMMSCNSAGFRTRKGVDEEIPLHVAARSGNLEMVRFLCGDGRPEITRCRNVSGSTPLHEAFNVGLLRNRRVVIPGAWSKFALKSNFNPEIVKFLLKMDPEALTIRNFYGDTPLHMAVRRNQNVVRVIVENTPKSILNRVLGIRDNGGKTPEERAEQYGREDILEVLRSAR